MNKTIDDYKNKLQKFNKDVTTVDSGVVISVHNSKGGVSKTTMTVHIATGLAYMGLRVLVIDLDSQGDAGKRFGFDVDEKEETLYEFLFEGLNVKHVINKLKFTINDTKKSEIDLFLVLANHRLDELNERLVEGAVDENFLEESLGILRKYFDVVLFDCPPKITKIVRSAMYMSDEVIIPTTLDVDSILNIEKTKKLVDQIGIQRKRELNILGIAPSVFAANEKIEKDLYEELTEREDIVILPYVKKATSMKQARALNQIIYTFAAKEEVSRQYLELSSFIGKKIYKKYKGVKK